MATAHWGTHALKDLLASSQTIQDYGEARLLDDLRGAFDTHNTAVNEMLTPLVAFTNERLEPYGSTFSGTRVRGYRVDEAGAVDVQRARNAIVSESNIGYPLDRWQFAWGFTRDYIETATVADAAQRTIAVQQGDLDRIEYELKNAFFNPVSNLTYRDYLIDQLLIPIRRLANADSHQLPLGPNGQVFNGATHTHYVGRVGGAVAAADITALINNVIEHGVVGPVRILIPMSMEPTIRAMANFYPFQPIEIVNAETFPQMRNPGPLVPTVNPPNPENMNIGRWNAVYDVWTKPWIYDNYIVVLDYGKKPIRWRSRQNPSAAFGAQGRAALRVVGELEMFPLRAEWAEREFGMSVGDRVAAAILYAGGTSYVMPTITMPAL